MVMRTMRELVGSYVSPSGIKKREALWMVFYKPEQGDDGEPSMAYCDALNALRFRSGKAVHHG